MTTNVVDTLKYKIASDSRWSFPPIYTPTGLIHAVIYVDNVDFDKIEVGIDYSAVFAGDSKLIESWKAWLRDKNRNVIPRPKVEKNFAFCLVDMSTQIVKFEHGQSHSGSDYRFAGSGADGAFECWKLHKDAIKAVESACKKDMFSGGEVKSLELKTGKHNVSKENSSRSINELTAIKGGVMYITPSSQVKHMSVTEASLNDPFVSDAMKHVANGSLSAQAPAGADNINWTETDEQRLDKALAECFGKK